MPYPETGGSGGSGFGLGPEQNQFTGADQAAAQLARNNYASANATWLSLYNMNRSFLIELTYGSTTVFQRRNVAGDDWEDSTGVIQGPPGQDGVDGMGVIDQTIPAGTVLRAVDDGGSIVPGASALMDTGTEVQSSRRIMAPDGGGVRLGGTTFYNAANGVAAQTADGDIFYPVASRFDPTSGTSQPFYLDVGGPQDLPVQAASSETITSGNVQFSFSSTNTGIAVQYRLISAKAIETTDVNITFELNSHGSGDVIFDWRRATGSVGATFPAGDGTTEFTLDLPLPAGLVFEEDVRIYVTISPPAGETVSVRGGDFTDGIGTQSNFPFVTARGLVGSTVPVITNNEFTGVLNRIQTLENTAFSSGRAFIRFNDGFTIDRNNIAQFEDRNIIYTAKNDKPFDSSTRPDINLPNDTEIQAAGETYPVVFEFTHLGGSGVFQDRNVVRFFLGGTELQRILREQVAIVIKPAAGQDYQFQTGGFDPNNSILPNGVFNLKRDTPIDNIANITAELSGLTIVAGDAYLVGIGGSWSGLTVPDGSVLVALVNNPSTADSATNNDWLLLDNPRVNAKSAALLANFDQDGIEFNASRNINVNPSNVNEFNSMATGTPLTRQLLTNTQGFNRLIRFDNAPIQLSDIVGGALDMLISIDTVSSSGFALEPLSLELVYPGGISFMFPLNSVQLDAGQFRLSINIPNIDYSAAFNQNASLRFRFNFRGAVYNGSYTIHALMNTSVGSLHDPIVQLIGRETARVESSLNQQIENVIGAVDDESRSLAAISDRISPYKTLTITAPEVFALYNDSSGVDPFPTDLSTLNDVSADNPQFVVNSTAAFIAVPAPGNFVLKDLTASTVLALDNSEAAVDLGESLAFEGRTYFVYRVTGLTSGNSFEIDKSTQERVVAWQSDLDNLGADIARIDAELEHAALNLPDDVVQVLDNELTVTEESTPTIIPSEYNKGLAGTASQVVFYEPSANTPSGGVLASRPINENTGDQARRKLVYIDSGTTYNNQAYLSAFDGTTGRDLIRYVNGVFNAQVFVPAKSAGTSTETIYPAPSNRVSGEGIWQRVPALTFVNGIPVAEADEIFFTRNVPSQAVTLNIQYRGHANGNVFGAGSATLAGVGGASDVFTTFVLNDGSEQATVEVLYRAAHRDIRVSVTERVNTGLPTINDVEVILSFDETRVVPATPATVREVAIEFEHPGGQVFAIKPSASGNLIIVGDRTEIDTGYTYTTLFGASETGHLILGAQTGVFLNYEDFEPIASTVTDLENHASLPQRGLFSTQYTRETLLNISVTIKPQGINVGDLPTAAAGLVSGDLWNDSGTLRIV